MIRLIAAFLLWHKPGGKGHPQKRHGWWSKKAYNKFAKRRTAARARLSRMTGGRSGT